MKKMHTVEYIILEYDNPIKNEYINDFFLFKYSKYVTIMKMCHFSGCLLHCLCLWGLFWLGSKKKNCFLFCLMCRMWLFQITVFPQVPALWNAAYNWGEVQAKENQSAKKIINFTMQIHTSTVTTLGVLCLTFSWVSVSTSNRVDVQSETDELEAERGSHAGGLWVI